MIGQQLKSIYDELPEGVRLVAVSKFHPVEAIQEAYQTGQRIFGESKVQELEMKRTQLPEDIEWHFIGHLQTNKVKYIVPYVQMIHAVDSFKLLNEIEKQAAKVNRIIPCLLEIHIASEDSKYGFSKDDCRQMLEEGDWKRLKHVQLCGVMGMASLTDDEMQIRHEFDGLHSFFDEIKQRYFAQCPYFGEISMGMSHDYPLAIEAGSTLIRVGSKIFGERNY